MAIMGSCRTTKTAPLPVDVSIAAGEAAKKAADRYQMRKNSLNWEDLKVLRHLGAGAFCDVLEVDNAGRVSALKRLRRDASESSSSFVDNVVDLTSEAAILTNLEHPNIIRVHGMAAGPIQDSVVSEEGFFMVMERLEETLQERIEVWKLQKNRHERRSLFDRLSAGLELAKAIQYMHSQNVVHRDLKPENIGFDSEGTLKLFDFGLAAKTTKRGLFGAAGTTCYMAPEMAMQQRYGSKVDVYSFGLLLWEICALEQVFEGYNDKRHMTRVVRNGERPRNRWGWPRALQNLLRSCWSPDAQERPTMDKVVETLERILKNHKKTNQKQQ